MRSFCRQCGTPLLWERSGPRRMINIPRALFEGRTGRQAIYHVNIGDVQDWTYTNAPLVPLKGYPGVVWEQSRGKKKREGKL